METSKNRIHGRLYVGGLAYLVDDDELRDLLLPFGQVRFVKVVRDSNSGRSKGFGFVEMATVEEAKEAVDKLHGSTYQGGTITVSFASSEDASQGG